MWTFLIAVVAATTLMGGLQWRASRTPISAAITFADEAFSATPMVAAALGAPLTPDEIAAIKRAARGEVERAFADLRVRFVETPRAFWRVRVIPDVVLRRNRRSFNPSGASYGLGILGGAGFVNFTTLALNAIRYAPPGTPRREMVIAIGRGIGRSAVHELAHLMSPDVAIDRHPDENSYEHSSTARVSQYYGDLHWAVAGPVLRERLGR